MSTKEEYMDRWARAAHAMQTGVMHDQSTGSQDGSPKHLRTGINTALSDHASLVRLLIEKGVITELEYYKAIAEGMEAERERYERLISEKFGSKVTLG